MLVELGLSRVVRDFGCGYLWLVVFFSFFRIDVFRFFCFMLVWVRLCLVFEVFGVDIGRGCGCEF